MLREAKGAQQGRANLHRVAKLRSIEWLGQIFASSCWMTSMAFYGLDSLGDWLQLCAATAWTVANVASLYEG